MGYIAWWAVSRPHPTPWEPTPEMEHDLLRGDGSHRRFNHEPIEGDDLTTPAGVKVYESFPQSTAASCVPAYVLATDWAHPPRPGPWTRLWRRLQDDWLHHVSWRFQRSGRYWDGMDY